MRNYRSIMEQVALSDQKKEEIMSMIQNHTTGKRHVPRGVKLGLAAALAVGCVLSIAAGLPAQVYNFVAGGVMTVLPGTDQAFFYFTGEDASPIVLKDGQVWLEVDGEKLDITSKTDEDIPYILERTDPASGNKGWLVVGGPADDLGWVELVQFGDTCAIGGDNFALPGSISLDDFKDIQPAEDGSFVVGGEVEMVDYPVYRPWLDTALKQLGLDVEMGLAD